MTQQTWINGKSGDWSTAADWLSGVVPSSTDDVFINNSNAVTLNGTAVANSLTLDLATLTVSGTLNLGTSLTLHLSELALSGGTLSAQTITSPDISPAGQADIPGSELVGYGTVSGALPGGVNIFASGGTLKIEGSLAGDQGFFLIGPVATLELSSGTTQLVLFVTNATLKLDAPTAFTGTLGFDVVGQTSGDMIDLVGITASSATYSGNAVTGFTLTVNETNGQQLTYNFSNAASGAYLVGDTFLIASDGNGGTLVSWVQPSESWITGTSGDWSKGADWLSGVAPSSTDNVLISNSTAVTVDGTAVANSLTLDGATLTVSGALTLGTSLTLDNAQLTLSGGTLSVHSIIGSGSVSGAVSGDVNIIANGGTLMVQGSLAGDTGTFNINSGATLELSNTTLVGTIDFANNIGTLKLDTPAAFTGLIAGVTVGDMIDLAGITASSVTISEPGAEEQYTTVTINETNGQKLSYGADVRNASGSLVTDSFLIGSDNNGGTLIYVTNPLPTQATTIQQEIAGLYAAVYDRAADSLGMQYWVNVVSQQADALGITYSAAANTPISPNDAALLGQLFVSTQSAYFNQTYGNLNDTDFVNALYFNMGGQNAETPSAIAYWVNIIQNEESSGLSVQNARAAMVGQFVHDLIDVNLAQWTKILTPSELETTILRQAVVDNKLAVSLAYLNASAGLGGSILNAHAVGDAGFQAEVRALSGVAIDPSTATVQITGINQAVSDHNLADIQPV